MKKATIIMLSIFLMVSSTSFSQEIRVDEAIMTDYHSWSLESIELKDNCTLCKWKVTSLTSDTYVNMTKGVYLEDTMTGKKYYSDGVEGIPLEPGQKIIASQYASVDFVVRYRRLDRTI